MPEKILLLYGGFSAEKDVSVSSKDDIKNALLSKGYEVIEHNLQDAYQFIDAVKKYRPDVIYNGLYGNWGEDGEIQGLLDLLQIPYTHSGLKASVLGMDKQLTKLLAEINGVKIADSEKMTYGEYKKNDTRLAYPYVLKPVCDGSSVGVFIIRNPQDKALVHYNNDDIEILIEKYIEGRELTVMCLNGKSYVVTELKAQSGFYDYKAKYTSGYTKHILPAEIPQDITDTCLRYAEIMHKALNCHCLSRCDFRYNPNDGVVFLEINTNPGMTSLSLVPEQAKYIGITYADLCDMLIKNATYRKI